MRNRAANIAAIAAILISGGVSTAWVFLVPIFQAPDEPAHFDYAMSIYSAHRLVRLSDGGPDWIVSPYTKYLMKAAEFDRIVRHTSMHVSPDYGTLRYFARIDAGAPDTRSDALPRGKISYIVALYPFGFYALEATWLHIVALFTTSLAALFFAARILGVLLLMAGLYFNYRTALNLCVPRWASAGLIFAIGVLPLTSFVSSSVQPDNLTYFLVSVVLFFGTEIRRTVPSPTVVAALGLTLGLLAVTKYQFFLSAAIAVLLVAAARFQYLGPSLARRCVAVALLVAPAILFLAVQILAVDRSGSGFQATQLSKLEASQLQSVLALGARPTITYVTSMAGNAFIDCFVSGICAATFWQPGGWADTAMVLFSPVAEVLIRTAISFITVVVAAVVVFFCFKRFLRLIAGAVRGHAQLAFRVFAGDPVFNSYLVFVAIMFALYVISNNAYGASGRHWYPYVFAGFLCFVWYAPRALRRREQRVTSVLICVLLTYTIASCSYAIFGLKQRYYGPQIANYLVSDPKLSKIVSRPATGTLWPVAAVAYYANATTPDFSFAKGTPLRVTGAALPNANAAPTRVAVLLDGWRPLPVLSGQYLVGIAEATHNIADGFSGFIADISASDLAEGPHTVEAYAAVDSTAYERLEPLRIFFVTNEANQFSSQFAHRLANAQLLNGGVDSVEVCRGDLQRGPGIPTVSHGAVLLLRGKIAASRPLRSYSAVWFLVDRSPYPARYDRENRIFLGTVPTGRLQSGPHHIAAFAIRQRPLEYLKMSRQLTVDVEADKNESFLRNPPPDCADPLRQMIGP